MADDCQLCPELLARLAGVSGGLHALALFIDAELNEPTMPWRELLPLVAMRVDNLADQAEGRY